MSGFLLLLMEFRPKAVEDTAPPKVAVASIAGRVQEAAIPGYPDHPGLHNVTAVTIDLSSQSIEFKLTLGMFLPLEVQPSSGALISLIRASELGFGTTNHLSLKPSQCQGLLMV